MVIASLNKKVKQELMLRQALKEKENNLKLYNAGEKEYRPWGYFSVLDVGVSSNEEFCEKEIVMMPNKAMSVQRHALRREYWQIIEGTLTVILNGEIHILEVGETIDIPLKAVHCMINPNDKKAIIHERQTGVCREGDNERLHDINGRDTMAIDMADINVLASIELYKRVIKNL